MEAGRRKLLLQIAACAVLACALTIALTYPVAFNAANHVPSDLGDPLLCCWLLWWNYEHILTLNFDGYWDAPIFHPFPKGLALAEHMFGPSLISAPLYPLTHDLVLIYNLLFLGTYFFALTGMVALARHLKLSWPAAWLAGIIFTFCSHHYSQIPHLQVLYGGLAPWSMFFLLRLTKKPGLWDALGLFASFWLICFSCLYHAAFFSVILGISGVFLFFSRRLWNKPKSLALILLAPVLAVSYTHLRAHET